MLYSKLRTFTFILMVFLLIIKSALADLQKGIDAYEQGDHQTAIKEFFYLLQKKVMQKHNGGLVKRINTKL